MRLEKIKNILLLIKMMRSSASGVSLEDITKTFNVSYRTAQRMIAAVLLWALKPSISGTRSNDGESVGKSKKMIFLQETICFV